MKKWGFLLFLSVCLGITFALIIPSFPSNVEIQEYHPNDTWEDEESSENTQQKEITEDRIKQGDLLLVNSEHPVDERGIKSDIINVSMDKELTQGYVLLESDIYLSEDVAKRFSEMVAAAQKEGVSHFLVSSGFRDFEEQRELYEQRGAAYALPAGHSEHNLGLALDVGSTQTSMYEAAEAEWIKENAWKHGFILRYPQDKVDITGIEYEPWHLRYVGLPHSAIMMEKNFVLEEYLQYLREKKRISVEAEGKKYTIAYYPFSENLTIHIPENRKYEISGNNVDGVIMTIHE